MVKKKKGNLVKAKWIAKVLPGARVVVKTGDSVKCGEKLIDFGKTKEEKYDASEILTKVKEEKVKLFLEEWKGKRVNKDELMFTTGGLLPKRIYSPFVGTFVGMDEFFNLKFITETDEKEDILSPVTGKVVKVEKDKLELEFKALAFEGKSVVDGRVWGEMEFKVYDKVSDLTNRLEGKVILTSSSAPLFFMKAEVIGVAGVVTCEEFEVDSSETEIPILFLKKGVWSDLVDLSKEVKKVLLNSKAGRLLVIE